MKERPLRIFTSPQKISKHLHCPICHQVFDDPNRLSCGHTFCYMCIEQWANLSKVCPLCKKSLRHRRPEKDLIAASLIDEMEARCSHEKCEWTGVYSSLKKHQRLCDFRERKTFKSRNFDEIVELNDDEEMKQANDENNKGRKKLKQDLTQLEPIFPSSQELEQQNIDNSELSQRNTYRRNQNNSSQSSSNSFSQNISNKSNSQSHNSSLNLNLSEMLNNKVQDKLVSDQIQQYVEFVPLSKKQKDKRLLKNTGIFNFEGYLYNPKNQENEINEEKQELIDLSEEQKNPIDSNYFIIEKNKKQQGKIQKQSDNQTKNKWGLAFYLEMKKKQNLIKPKQNRKSLQSDQDSSNTSNPFNEPITQNNNKVPKSFIIIDSSEQSRCEKSLQSGQMSFSERKNVILEKTQQKDSVNIYGYSDNLMN